MSHTLARRPLKLSWAISLGLAATAAIQTTAFAEPPTRDQWYLDPPTTATAPASSIQWVDRDLWYLDAPSEYVIQARSHRTQEENVHIG
jgi:hypothetical protein